MKLVRDGLENEEEEIIEVEEGKTISGLLEEKGIPSEEVLVSRNGKVISDRHQLRDGDTVKVMDVIAGG